MKWRRISTTIEMLLLVLAVPQVRIPTLSDICRYLIVQDKARKE